MPRASFHEREVWRGFEIDFECARPWEARVCVQVVDGELFAGLRHGERGAQGFRVFVDGCLLRELLLEHLCRPTVVVLEVEVGRVRVAGFFERVIQGIDVGFEVEIIFEDAVLEEARTFGTNIPRLRAVCIVCCAAMTASCVAMCGQVGWVGLLVPHVCRLLFGNSHARLLPACISCGACFLMIVDTLARTISAAEIPVSILTAILGAPIFITIVRRKGGWSL